MAAGAQNEKPVPRGPYYRQDGTGFAPSESGQQHHVALEVLEPPVHHGRGKVL